MNRAIVSLFFTFILSTATITAHAGHGYHGYHSNRGYNHYHGSRSYYSDQIWTAVGVGVLTGVLVSMLTRPPQPKPQYVYYTPQPPVLIQAQPVRFQQRSSFTTIRQVTVLASKINLRFGPDLHSTVIGQLRSGSTVGVIGAAPGWLYIKTTGGQRGWVMSKYTNDRQNSQPVG